MEVFFIVQVTATESDYAMSTDIKIFVSCHKPNIHIPHNALLKPIHVGAALSSYTLNDMIQDDFGESISQKNRSYCELTGQYWAWKNTDADYYGFFHYRRYFNFSKTEFPTHHEPFIFGDVVLDRNDDATLKGIDFTEARMQSVITSHDFIAPTPVESLSHETVYENYRDSVGHHIEDLDTVMDIIHSRYPEIAPSAERYLHQSKIYACNMFIMKREIFQKYSAFLFDVLAIHEKLRNISHYSPVARRVSGYLGERICGMYLTYLYDKGYNGVNLQRVYFRNTDEADTGDIDESAQPLSENVKLTPTIRANGKIYSLINANKCFADMSFRATSRTLQSAPLPAKVVRTIKGQVLVLPVIGADQIVSLQAVDAQGMVHQLGEQTVKTHVAQLKSVTNRIANNPITRVIRNCDMHSTCDNVQVKIDHLIDNLDGTDIIHGHVSIPFTENKDVADYVTITALDTSGNPIALEDWICMGDEISEQEDLPGIRVRKISYSLHIPRSAEFIIWAQFPDSSRQDGFLPATAYPVQMLRREWAQQTEPACAAQDYDVWFRKVHRASYGELDAQRRITFHVRPKFSIIVPLYRTPIPFFRDMVNSVLAQTYTNWELLLINASPDDAELSVQIEKLRRHDHRIRLIQLAKNEGITLNTNKGIKAATGDFLCFLDHDDVLEPDALFCYTRAINIHSDTDMLYCDEDKLDSGKYREPFFKTEWNPDLLLGMNYVCHFLAVRKTIVDTLALPGKEYDGSQDWHMTFRVGEQARYIHHEPRVLYHWRVHDQSTAKSAEQKDYTLDSSRLSIQTHLERCGIKGRVLDSPLVPRRFVVDYDLGNHPLVSIIIPNKDAVTTLHQCLSSIKKKTTYDNYEIVIVENNSTDPYIFEYYSEIQRNNKRIRVVELKGLTSFNFSRIINYGAQNARGDYFLLLNNDTEVITSNWIEQLLGPCMRNDVGITGAKLLFPDDTIQHAGISFGPDGPGHLYYELPRMRGGNFEATLVARNVGAVTGACLMVSRQTFEQVHGMEEELAVNYNDIDFCLKVTKIGKRIVFCPTAELRHYESVSRGSETQGLKVIRSRKERGELMCRWPKTFTPEAPFENPNLQFGIIYQVLNRFEQRQEW